MGVIAARNIAKGERILLDPPLFSIASVSAAAVDLCDALAKVSQEQLDAFSGLPACSNFLDKGMQRLRAIMATNSLPLGRISGVEWRGLFLVAARFNHSCRHNVVHCWNPTLKGETLHAAADISAGEELCINPIIQSIIQFNHPIIQSNHPIIQSSDPIIQSSNPIIQSNPGEELCITYISEDEFNAPRTQRRHHLEQGWAFDCSCATCSLEGAELAASDSRRLALRRMSDDIYAAISADQVPKGLRLVEQTLELLRDEGLEHPGTAMGCGPFAYDAYQGCKVTDKHKEARVWLQLAHDESVLAGGEDGTQAQYYAELLERPLTADHHP
jgi:hypothetical protein